MCLAVPGRIIEIRDDQVSPTGTVDFGGVCKEINLSFVPEAKTGDYVLVHAGFALNTIDEDEANKVFEYLRELEELGLDDPEALERRGSEEHGGRPIDGPGLDETDEPGGRKTRGPDRSGGSEEPGP